MALLRNIDGKKFEVAETRTLTIPDDRLAGIDAKHLIDGRLPVIEVSLERTEDHGHQARFFTMTINGSPAKVQLNHGDPADDEQRLEMAAISLIEKTEEVTLDLVA